MKLAILGCGNMSQALVKGLHKTNKILEYYTYTPTATRAEKLALELGGTCVKEIKDIPSCDIYLIACKPQQFDTLSKDLKLIINNKSLVISILAGTKTQTIQNKLNVEKVLRIMPNTPSLVGHGVNAFYFTSEVGKNTCDHWKKIFSEFSQVFVFDKEESIDVITPYSGSGPAYFFEISRIMTKNLVGKGVDEGVASDLINHTLLGAAKLMVESNENSETLRNNVTSKNGVTYEALEVFKKSDLEGLFSLALNKAYDRALELGNDE